MITDIKDELEILNKIREALRDLPKRKMFTGEFVLLDDGEIITDHKSGVSYCTQKAWDALKAATIPAEKAR